MSERFTEKLHDDYAQSLGVTEVLYDNNSSLQHIQALKITALDGC